MCIWLKEAVLNLVEHYQYSSKFIRPYHRSISTPVEYVLYLVYMYSCILFDADAKSTQKTTGLSVSGAGYVERWRSGKDGAERMSDSF